MQRPFDSGPAAPVDVAISDVPVAPVAVSFVSEPPAKVPLPATRRTPERASSARRIAGWAIDLTFLALLLAAHILAAVWIAVGAALALAWSWVFVSLWGRTPGMAFTGQRLRTLEGQPLGPIVAFARALLAVFSGALGLF